VAKPAAPDFRMHLDCGGILRLVDGGHFDLDVGRQSLLQEFAACRPTRSMRLRLAAFALTHQRGWNRFVRGIAYLGVGVRINRPLVREPMEECFRIVLYEPWGRADSYSNFGDGLTGAIV